MKQWQITVLSLRLIFRSPLRSGLLALSAALGVGGVICSVNYGASGTQKVLDQIRRLGTNVLIVTPAQSRSIAGRARTGAVVTTLVDRDYAAIKRNILARTRSSALATQSFWTKASDLSKNATVDLSGGGEVFEDLAPGGILGRAAAVTFVDDDEVEEARREFAE